MTPEQFRKASDHMGITVTEIAGRMGVNRVTPFRQIQALLENSPAVRPQVLAFGVAGVGHLPLARHANRADQLRCENCPVLDFSGWGT
jgi:hypothetical protein